jgi:hypothetical protein
MATAPRPPVGFPRVSYGFVLSLLFYTRASVPVNWDTCDSPPAEPAPPLWGGGKRSWEQNRLR